tara:strand:+ start:2138 stop:2815 length:678 start_codon:yes stop_codon:yes gene_type:complete
MELSKEQLLQIDNYVFVSGIKYYDVRTEIVDHFANILEQKLEKNPDIDFRKEIENIHKNFSDKGFSKLLKEKTNSVTKTFYKDSLKHLISFFKLPKILISVVVFYALFLLMNYVEDKEDFFKAIAVVLILSYFTYVSVLFFKKENKKEKFLTLNKSSHFNVIAMNIYQIFFFVTSVRSSDSFLNQTQNNIQLGVFVLILLFFWSGEYVYQQNKKLVKEQYPNILV